MTFSPSVNGLGSTISISEEAETVSVHPFDTGEVTAFTYLIDDQLAMFSLEDGTWLYMTDTTWQIDAGKVEDFLEEMSRTVRLNL